jgi:glycerate-2-kinase
VAIADTTVIATVGKAALEMIIYCNRVTFIQQFEVFTVIVEGSPSFAPLVEQRVLEGCFVHPSTHCLTLQAGHFSLSLVIVMRKQMD